VTVAKSGVAIVVVGFDSGDVWPQFFDSLSSSTTLPERVVVVENSPHVPRIDSAALPFPLEIVHQPDNPGYGAAANAGVAILPQRIPFVVVCNPDVVFESATLEDLTAALDSHPNAGVAGPRILNADGSVYPSARAFPGIRVGVGHALFADIWKNNPWTSRYLGRYEGTETRVVDWVSGALMMFRREALDAVGGFDPGYFMFLEDVDVCFRLKRLSWRSVYAPIAALTHSGAHATKKNMSEMVTIHHESARRFLSLLYDKPIHAPLRGMLRLGLALRRLLATRRYRKLTAG